MTKRKFYNYLSKKYDLPTSYIRFQLDSYYLVNHRIERNMEELEDFENKFYWDRIQESFENDRNFHSSIFYKMKKPSEW